MVLRILLIFGLPELLIIELEEIYAGYLVIFVLPCLEGFKGLIAVSKYQTDKVFCSFPMFVIFKGMLPDSFNVLFIFNKVWWLSFVILNFDFNCLWLIRIKVSFYVLSICYCLCVISLYPVCLHKMQTYFMTRQRYTVTKRYPVLTSRFPNPSSNNHLPFSQMTLSSCVFPVFFLYLLLRI